MCYVKAINEVDLISYKMAHLATGSPCRPHRRPYFHKIAILTRTHSSRMRTIRCSRGMSARGVSAHGGVSAQGGVCSGGWGCLPSGGVCHTTTTTPREQNDRHM